MKTPLLKNQKQKGQRSRLAAWGLSATLIFIFGGVLIFSGQTFLSRKEAEVGESQVEYVLGQGITLMETCDTFCLEQQYDVASKMEGLHCSDFAHGCTRAVCCKGNFKKLDRLRHKQVPQYQVNGKEPGTSASSEELSVLEPKDPCDCASEWYWEGRTYHRCSRIGKKEWCEVTGPKCDMAYRGRRDPEILWKYCKVDAYEQEREREEEEREQEEEEEEENRKREDVPPRQEEEQEEQEEDNISPCQCKLEWEWKGKSHQLCSFTDAKRSWCYVIGGGECEAAYESKKSKNLFWRYCDSARPRGTEEKQSPEPPRKVIPIKETPRQPKEDSDPCCCKNQWTYEDEMYKGCSKTGDDKPWCYVDAGSSCENSFESKTNPTLFWRYCEETSPSDDIIIPMDEPPMMHMPDSPEGGLIQVLSPPGADAPKVIHIVEPRGLPESQQIHILEPQGADAPKELQILEREDLGDEPPILKVMGSDISDDSSPMPMIIPGPMGMMHPIPNSEDDSSSMPMIMPGPMGMMHPLPSSADDSSSMPVIIPGPMGMMHPVPPMQESPPPVSPLLQVLNMQPPAPPSTPEPQVIHVIHQLADFPTEPVATEPVATTSTPTELPTTSTTPKPPPTAPPEPIVMPPPPHQIPQPAGPQVLNPILQPLPAQPAPQLPQQVPEPPSSIPEPLHEIPEPLHEVPPPLDSVQPQAPQILPPMMESLKDFLQGKPAMLNSDQAMPLSESRLSGDSIDSDTMQHAMPFMPPISHLLQYLQPPPEPEPQVIHVIHQIAPTSSTTTTTTNNPTKLPTASTTTTTTTTTMEPIPAQPSVQ